MEQKSTHLRLPHSTLRHLSAPSPSASPPSLPPSPSPQMEEFSPSDLKQLIQSATDFAYSPVAHSEAAVKEFLGRFPLPVIISALQTQADVPEVEPALVPCLERIFETKYAASLIPHYMPFLQVGLRAESQVVRCLACKTVSCLFENFDDSFVSPAQDERTAAASMDAILNFARSLEGIAVIFPADNNEGTSLRNLAAKTSPLGRVRILALIVKLFSLSHEVASVISTTNLLSLFETEVSSTSDTLVTLTVLELLYEMAEIQHSAEFLSKTTLLQLLSSIISTSAESILRSRALMISGRMLSTENDFKFVDESSVRTVISATEDRLRAVETVDQDECESAIEALGQIGSSTHGADLLFSSLPSAIRFVIHAAFDNQRRGKQLAALHAVGNIIGEARPESGKMLSPDHEENLRQFIYETASNSSKLTPSGLFLSLLQQDSEIRLAGYRLVTGLAARPWFLMEICSRQEIINIVTDPYIESMKISMEARHKCCQAIYDALAVSTRLGTDPALARIAVKLQEALKRGPYLARKHAEATPTVMTEQRF
ncbi:26S proteasome non-ATPase regulatory subunit 5-like protein [Drosera capensis]